MKVQRPPHRQMLASVFVRRDATPQERSFVPTPRCRVCGWTLDADSDKLHRLLTSKLFVPHFPTLSGRLLLSGLQQLVSGAICFLI